MYLIQSEDGGLGYWRTVQEQIEQHRIELARKKTEQRETRDKARLADFEAKAQRKAEHQKRRAANQKKRLRRLASKNRLRFLRGADDRDSEAYKAWRVAVLRRDGFRCVKCHSKENLHVHHCFETYADNPKRRLDINNGVTVCEKCHIEIHPWMKDT